MQNLLSNYNGAKLEISNREIRGKSLNTWKLYITGILKEHFDIALCHPKNSKDFANDVDLI